MQIINIHALHPCARSLCSLVSCSYICKYINITASHRDAALFRDLSGNHIHGYVQGYHNIGYIMLGFNTC